MSKNQDLSTLIRASTPLLLVESNDETAVIEGFRHAIAQALRPLYSWSITAGLQRLDLSDDEDQPAPDATVTLQKIKLARQPGVYL
ncbi:MAG: ATPase, partial [Lysobacteraceae bacterium]